jgi:hypothetical protein
MSNINEDIKNILFDKIYEHIKNTLFSDIYFKFEGSIRNLSLSNFIDSFHLGSAFIEVCETLELDVNKVKECILKYVFHQLYEESLKLSLEELQVLRDCYDESILNVQLEDILWKEYFHSPDHYMDYYEKPLLAMKYSASTEEYQREKEEIFKKLFDNIPYSEYLTNDLETNKEWCIASKKSGSFLHIFRYYKRNIEKKAFNKRPSKFKFVDKEFLTFVNNTVEYLNLLELLEKSQKELYDGESFNHSEDLLNYERETGLFFILKCYVLLKNEGIKGETVSEEYLKVLSAFSLIDDLNLKLYLARVFIEQGIYHLSKQDIKGFVKLFEIILIYIPFLKDFVKEKIYSMAPPSLAKILGNNNGTNDIEEEKINNIKKKLYLYAVLRKNNCYELKQIKQELDINKLTNLNVIDAVLFEKLYKKVFKLRREKNDFFEDINEFISSEYARRNDEASNDFAKFIEDVLAKIAIIFMYDGELLALPKPKDSEENNILEEYINRDETFFEKRRIQFEKKMRELLSGE